MSILMFLQSSVIVLVSILSLVLSDAPTRRVFYGTNARIEEFPYYAGLAHCGGAIISERWIVTAAHCVSYTRSPNDYVWVGGESFQNSNRIPYEKVIIHQGHQPCTDMCIHDIALIKLSRPLKFSSKIKPVALPNPTGFTNTGAVFVGRGFDETYRPSEAIMKLDLEVLPMRQCVQQALFKYLRPYETLLNQVSLCARRHEDKPTICMGDSGSPLVSNNTLVGLASFGSEVCENARVAFYVNVVNYVSWIKFMTVRY